MPLVIENIMNTNESTLKMFLFPCSFCICTNKITKKKKQKANPNLNFCYFPYQTDTIPPTIACIDDVFETVSPGVFSKPVSWTEPTATDNSGGTIFLISRSHAPGSPFNIGSTQVTYIFSDESGNTANCTFTITITEGKFDN